MAGGQSAVLKAREGVEDNYEEGARSITRLRPGKKDVVIGVSASGMTQFVRGALTRARRAGSKIIFVTCDPRTELQTFVDLTIAPAVGPEVIAGLIRAAAMGRGTRICEARESRPRAPGGCGRPAPATRIEGGYPQARLSPGTKKPRTMPGLLSC